MARLFSGILVSFFLLFQTTAIADEENASVEIAMEENENSEENDQSDVETEATPEEKEAPEELSELEKEARAAEEAELRESGLYEEPIEE